VIDAKERPGAGSDGFENFGRALLLGVPIGHHVAAFVAVLAPGVDRESFGAAFRRTLHENLIFVQTQNAIGAANLTYVRRLAMQLKHQNYE
jgi:hypothetical protein